MSIRPDDSNELQMENATLRKKLAASESRAASAEQEAAVLRGQRGRWKRAAKELWGIIHKAELQSDEMAWTRIDELQHALNRYTDDNDRLRTELTTAEQEAATWQARYRKVFDHIAKTFGIAMVSEQCWSDADAVVGVIDAVSLGVQEIGRVANEEIARLQFELGNAHSQLQSFDESYAALKKERDTATLEADQLRQAHANALRDLDRVCGERNRLRDELDLSERQRTEALSEYHRQRELEGLARAERDSARRERDDWRQAATTHIETMSLLQEQRDTARRELAAAQARCERLVEAAGRMVKPNCFADIATARADLIAALSTPPAGAPARARQRQPVPFAAAIGHLAASLPTDDHDLSAPELTRKPMPPHRIEPHGVVPSGTAVDRAALLETMTPEQAAKFVPVSEEGIRQALAEGAAEREYVEGRGPRPAHLPAEAAARYVLTGTPDIQVLSDEEMLADATTVGKRIRYYRTKAGKTMGELARHLGVSVPAVSDLEREREGQGNLLDWPTLAKIANFIGVREADLAPHSPPPAAQPAREVRWIRGRLDADDDGFWFVPDDGLHPLPIDSLKGRLLAVEDFAPASNGPAGEGDGGK